jgi:ketosteroid isomerase-like protein
MSQGDIERIKLALDAFAARDADALIALGIHPDAEFKTAIAATDVAGGVYKGEDGLRQWTRDLDEALEDLGGEFEEIHELDGGRYLLSGRFRGRGRGSGAEFDVQMYWVYVLEDGLLKRFEAHFDQQDALDSVGLEAWPDT